MFKLNEVVVYRKEVYRILEKKRNTLSREEFYILIPYHEREGLMERLQVPAANRMGYLRKLSTKEEIENLIQRMPEIPVIEGSTRTIENEYRSMLKNASLEDLVRIIKTCWQRNKDRKDQNKKAGSVDENYFRQAEKYLVDEIAAVYQISCEEAKDFLLKATGVK